MFWIGGAVGIVVYTLALAYVHTTNPTAVDSFLTTIAFWNKKK